MAVARPRPLFVGRSLELDVIASSLDAIARHGPTVVNVIAPSGFGKSALLVRALADGHRGTRSGCGAPRRPLHTLTTLRTAVTPIVRLFAGDPDDAVAYLRDAIAGWSTRGWFFQHQEACRNESLADMYRGEPVRALERLAAKRDVMKSSLMLRMQNQRILLYGMEGVAAIAAAEQEPRRRADYVRLARKRGAELQGERNAWSAAVGGGIAARLARSRKRPMPGHSSQRPSRRSPSSR